MTFYLSSDNTEAALLWEEKFLQECSQISTNYPYMEAVYSAQSSMEVEILKVSTTNHVTLILSYTLSFVYVAFALTRLLPIRSKFVIVDSKVSLGTLKSLDFD